VVNSDVGFTLEGFFEYVVLCSAPPFSLYRSSKLQEHFSILKLQNEEVAASNKVLNSLCSEDNDFSKDNLLELFGLSFVYNPKLERYQVLNKYYDLKELI
jgi:hypothetical protein